MSHQSIEAGCMISAVEGDLDAVRERLRRYMSDGELTEFYEHVSTLLDLVGNEITLRRESWGNGTVDGIRPHRPMSQEDLDLQRRTYEKLYQSTPVADTGEINVIRGRE